MATICLARVDYRLVHGQVVVRWSKEFSPDRIVVADDLLSRDDMMKSIYQMAAPSNYAFSMLSVQEFVDAYNGGTFGNERLLVLFQSIASCYAAVKAGLPLDRIQLGNTAKKPGNTGVCKYIFINQDEFKLLQELQTCGTEVYMQNVPGDPALKFSVIEKKMS